MRSPRLYLRDRGFHSISATSTQDGGHSFLLHRCNQVEARPSACRRLLLLAAVLRRLRRPLAPASASAAIGCLLPLAMRAVEDQDREVQLAALVALLALAPSAPSALPYSPSRGSAALPGAWDAAWARVWEAESVAWGVGAAGDEAAHSRTLSQPVGTQPVGTQPERPRAPGPDTCQSAGSQLLVGGELISSTQCAQAAAVARAAAAAPPAPPPTGAASSFGAQISELRVRLLTQLLDSNAVSSSAAAAAAAAAAHSCTASASHAFSVPRALFASSVLAHAPASTSPTSPTSRAASERVAPGETAAAALQGRFREGSGKVQGEETADAALRAAAVLGCSGTEAFDAPCCAPCVSDRALLLHPAALSTLQCEDSLAAAGSRWVAARLRLVLSAAGAARGGHFGR